MSKILFWTQSPLKLTNMQCFAQTYYSNKKLLQGRTEIIPYKISQWKFFLSVIYDPIKKQKSINARTFSKNSFFFYYIDATGSNQCNNITFCCCCCYLDVIKEGTCLRRLQSCVCKYIQQFSFCWTKSIFFKGIEFSLRDISNEQRYETHAPLIIIYMYI